MPHRETIKFPENLKELDEAERGRLNPHQHRRYSKVRKILATTRGLRRALDETQEACNHPEDFVKYVARKQRYTCTLCGKASYKDLKG